MSTRITRKDLEQSLTIFCNRAGLSQDTFTLDQYGGGVGWRINYKDERHFSPRLSAKELDLWLSGAIAALDIRPRE